MCVEISGYFGLSFGLKLLVIFLVRTQNGGDSGHAD